MYHDLIIFRLKQNGISDNILNLLFNSSRNRKQRLVLKRQASSLADVDVWVPHGSTFGSLLFLIDINDLTGDLLNSKQFGADNSLFHNVNISADEVNNDLVKFNKWAYQWKMSFDPDLIQ